MFFGFVLVFFLSLKYDIKRLMEMRHSTDSKQEWLPPLLIESVVAEKACGVGGKELSPLPQNLHQERPSAPSTLGPPWSVKSAAAGLSSAALLRNLGAALTVTNCRSQELLPEPA